MFLLVVAGCSSSNTLNRPSPNVSAMIVDGNVPQCNTRLLDVVRQPRRVKKNPVRNLKVTRVFCSLSETDSSQVHADVSACYSGVRGI